MIMPESQAAHSPGFDELSIRDLSLHIEASDCETEKKEAELAKLVKFNELRASLWRIAATEDLPRLKLIKRILAVVGPALGVCKITYDELITAQNGFKTVVRWLRPDVPIRQSINIPWSLASAYMRQSCVILPGDAKAHHLEVIKTLMDQAGEKSSIFVPFPMEAGAVRRFVSFADTESERSWDPLERQLLEELVEIISSLIEYDHKQSGLVTDISKFQAFVENSNTIIYSISRDGTLTYLSPSVEEILGFKTDDVIGKPYTIFFHSHDVAASQKVLTSVIEDGKKISNSIFRVKHTDGSWRWFSTNAAPYQDEFDNNPYFLGVAIDITSRIEAEKRIKQEQQRFYQLVEHLPIIVLETDIQGVITYLNRQAEIDTGYSKKELTGKHCLESVPIKSSYRDLIVQLFNDFMKGGPIDGEEIVVYSKSGKELHLAIHALPMQNSLLGVFINITDLKLATQTLKKAYDELEIRIQRRTRQLQLKNQELNQEIKERKAIEEELRRLQQKLHLVIDTIPQYIFWKDRDCVYQGCNANFAKVAGVGSPEEIVGKSDYELAWTKEQSDFFVNWDKRVMETDTPEYNIIEPQNQAGGRKAWLNTNKIPLHNQDGEVIGVLGTYDDITDTLEEQKREKMREQQLIHADKMISLGILVSGVAHEINNPNQFILSHLTPLKRAFDGILPILEEYRAEFGDFRIAGMNYSDFKERLPGIFDNLVSGSNRIKNIVAELREYIADFPSEHTESIQFNSVVESALTLLDNLIKKSTIAFHVEYGQDLPFFKGHYQRLEQVIINLVQNACQALTSEKDAIRVSTQYDREQKEIVFTVADEGCGIPAEHMERVTDLFFTTKRDIGGTGLGLAISSKIALEHSGKLSFARGKEKGTVATLTIPLVRESEPKKIHPPTKIS